MGPDSATEANLLLLSFNGSYKKTGTRELYILALSTLLDQQSFGTCKRPRRTDIDHEFTPPPALPFFNKRSRQFWVQEHHLLHPSNNRHKMRIENKQGFAKQPYNESSEEVSEKPKIKIAPAFVTDPVTEPQYSSYVSTFHTDIIYRYTPVLFAALSRSGVKPPTTQYFVHQLV